MGVSIIAITGESSEAESFCSLFIHTGVSGIDGSGEILGSSSTRSTG